MPTIYNRLCRHSPFSHRADRCFLVGQRGENAQPVQLRRDLGCTCALQPHTENITDNTGGVRIGNKLILVVLRLHIAIYRERSDKIAVAPLHIQRATGLDGNITAVGFVHYVFYRYGKIIAAAVVSGVDVVGDGDEAHTVGREHPGADSGLFRCTRAPGGRGLSR